MEGTVEKKTSTTRTRKPASTEKPTRAAAKPGARARSVSTDPPSPTHEQIAQRAHDLYVHSGCMPGREQEFWLEAERQLRDETKPVGV
jgi:hypothetical protein